MTENIAWTSESTLDPDLILLSGYGKVPEGVSSRALYYTVGVIVVVRRSTGEIVHLDSTLLTGLATDFLRAQVIGLSLRNDVVLLYKRISSSYLGMSRGAVLESLRRIIERFEGLDQSGEVETVK
ncbi:MAG: DUF3870 domain-containing protein [Alcaligenaceae bacterium]|nr:MAG: DUF3870 domain-containing protein [Alcaligenaceae bacterium]